MPFCPVHALAQPEFATTAKALFALLLRFFMLTSTGAALNRFFVKTAQQCASVPLLNKARSFFELLFFIPHETPDA
jgi:hypothetical protein